MKEYCVDLEIAKELKENGFPQKGLFWWNEGFICRVSNYYLCRQQGYIKGNHLSAPISDEILKELPKRIPNHQSLCIVKDDQTYWCGYEGKTLKDEFASSGKKLSNALAKLWLYLKKEGLLK